MEVKLLTSTASLKDMEQFAAIAALTCHANTDKEFVAPDVLERIINWKHDSILEHINLTYSVKGLSRACLQELARHRHLTLSVESTRHTLRQQLLDKTIQISLPGDIDEELRGVIMGYLTCLISYMHSHPNTPNDHIKYAIPECVCTNLIMTMNIRELCHILALRTAPAALKEFRDFAHALYDAVPEKYRYLLADCVHEEVSGSEKSNN